MSGHHRDWAEKAEKQVANALNGEDTNTYIQRIALAIQTKINKPYVKAVWVGSEEYNSKGDVHLYQEDGTIIPIELKFSKKEGSGTKANTTTEIVKDYLSEEVQSYPEFDEQFRKERYNYLGNIVGLELSKKQYETALRKFRESKRSVLTEIENNARRSAEAYASYLADKMNNNLNETTSFAVEILKGNNTRKKSKLNEELVYCVIKNFNKENQSVSFYDLNNTESTICSVVATRKTVRLLNQFGKDVLRLSVHWKNICQGGKTPCFNIFLGEACG